MERAISFLGEDFVATIDYKVTAAAYRGRMPDLNQPGEPAEPMEFEVTLKALRRDIAEPSAPDKAKLAEIWGAERVEATFDVEWQAAYLRRMDEWRKTTAPLDTPDWLKQQIEAFLEGDSDTCDAISEAESEPVDDYDPCRY